jgi:hypothetical protein
MSQTTQPFTEVLYVNGVRIVRREAVHMRFNGELSPDEDRMLKQGAFWRGSNYKDGFFYSAIAGAAEPKKRRAA